MLDPLPPEGVSGAGIDCTHSSNITTIPNAKRSTRPGHAGFSCSSSRLRRLGDGPNIS